MLTHKCKHMKFSTCTLSKRFQNGTIECTRFTTFPDFSAAQTIAYLFKRSKFHRWQLVQRIARFPQHSWQTTADIFKIFSWHLVRKNCLISRAYSWDKTTCLSFWEICEPASDNIIISIADSCDKTTIMVSHGRSVADSLHQTTA